MRRWWQEFADLVLPAECGGCGRPRAALCTGCLSVLRAVRAERVRPDPEPVGLPAVYAAAPYEDAVRAVLLAHKERGALGLAHALGAVLAVSVRAALVGSGGATEGSGGLGGPLLLVPVPSAPGAVRARGHHPVERIARAAAAQLRGAGTPVRVLDVLRQRRSVVDQSGLSSRQRLANLTGALTVAPGGGSLLRSGRAVLVDDLMTTGASLSEAARALCGTDVEGAEGGQRMTVRGEVRAAVVAASPDSFKINRN
ncbi:ComF family protein [Streptomyces tsukubensis]|uniref:Phosphoribosyltransferase n=1 Tax=Streptomyces tsukubensis TaxID=83656 RepID=A0A1V4A015_9ACTN|nr:ComF family protein [Streptomyces tsukubensis]OON72124.1 phosphoribosyltransferase [Streptomyces tsukubensis]QFR93928.1 ComF family protein [Streptomyces tsukubensis]